jgi:hypothetical protein
MFPKTHQISVVEAKIDAVADINWVIFEAVAPQFVHSLAVREGQAVRLSPLLYIVVDRQDERADPGAGSVIEKSVGVS